VTSQAPRGIAASPSRLLRALLVVVAVVTLAAAVLGCGAAAGEDDQGWFVRYERVWADGLRERETIWPDGRLLMKHGDYLERLTLTAADVDRLQTALEDDIAVGSPDDSPKRTITLGDGTVIAAARPEPGTITDLLDRLLDRHTLAS
jgi:hypothetical protein